MSTENLILEAEQLDSRLATENAGIDPAVQQAEVILQAANEAHSSLTSEMQTIMGMLIGMVAPMFPSVAAIYQPPVIAGLADATAKVCVKHGWLVNGIGGKYAEEMGLAFMVLPLAYATSQAVKTDLAAARAKAKAPAAEVPPA